MIHEVEVALKHCQTDVNQTGRLVELVVFASEAIHRRVVVAFNTGGGLSPGPGHPHDLLGPKLEIAVLFGVCENGTRLWNKQNSGSTGGARVNIERKHSAFHSRWV